MDRLVGMGGGGAGGWAATPLVGGAGGDWSGGAGATLVRAERTPAAAVPTSTEDLRRAYYTGPGAGWQWWVVEIDLDPAQLIVENDDDGFIYRVPYTVSGSGEVSFGEAKRVQVDYVDAPEAPAATARAARFVAASQAVGPRTPLVTYATRAEGRPAAIDPTQEDPDVTPEQLALLGLPADATAEQVNARLEELAALAEANPPDPDDPPVTTPAPEPTPTPEPEPTPPTGVTVPDGAVLVDAEQWADVQRQAAAGAAVAVKATEDERDGFLARAVSAGKFAPARLQHWTDLWVKDPDGTRATVESLAEGLIPVAARGHAQGASETGELGGAGEAYPASMLPEVAAREARKSVMTGDGGPS